MKIPPPGALIGIGGRSLHVSVSGNCRPAVVLESGIAASSLSWCLVQNRLAAFATVVSYDRAGFGLSEARPAPRDADHIADELHGLLLQAKGSLGDATAEYRLALRYQPDLTDALNNLAWVLATCAEASLRNGPQAVGLAQKANELSGGKDASLLRVLAAAYAEAGQFPKAAETAHRARDMVSPQSDNYDLIQGEIRRYDFGLPLRD